jgi:hypothetical protein
VNTPFLASCYAEQARDLDCFFRNGRVKLQILAGDNKLQPCLLGRTRKPAGWKTRQFGCYEIEKLFAAEDRADVEESKQ